MVDRAERGAALNALGERFRMVRGDVRSRGDGILPHGASTPRSATLRTGPSGSGRVNPDRERLLARHEVEGGLADFVRAGVYLLRHRGPDVPGVPVGTRGRVVLGHAAAGPGAQARPVCAFLCRRGRDPDPGRGRQGRADEPDGAAAAGDLPARGRIHGRDGRVCLEGCAAATGHPV